MAKAKAKSRAKATGKTRAAAKPTAKAAKPTAKAAPIAPPAAPPASPTIARLEKALAALAVGLPNPADESTDYFHGFTAPLAASVALSSASAKTALHVGARYTLDLSSADDLLANASDPVNWGADTAASWAQLATVLRATLTDVSVAFARASGVVRVRMWLFGRAADGTLVGLRSESTET